MKPISVIMIAYNAEKTLDRAMQSVLSQTLEDIEIICVDDCSTDSTLSMLNAYAARDPRITVLHHEKNMGCYGARRTGVMHATGEYTLQMDSDDELTPDACEVLHAEMQRQHVDVLQFKLIPVSDPAHPVPQEFLDTLQHYQRLPDAALFENLQPGDLHRLCFVESQFPHCVINKLYRTEVLKKALAQSDGENVRMLEDALISFMLFFHVKSYGVADLAVYHYYVGGGMSTSLSRMDEGKMQRTAAEYQVYTLLRQWTAAIDHPAAAVEEALQALRGTIRDAILWNFLHGALPEQAEAFHAYLAQYYPVKDFVRDLAQYVFVDHQCDQYTLAARLRQYPPFCDYSRIGRIKTVAMYYHRMCYGGVERVISQLTPMLAAKGLRVVVITQEKENPLDYPLPEGTVRICLAHQPNEPLARLEELQRIIAEYEIDAMVYHAHLSEALVLDSLAVKSMSIPLVLHTHGLASLLFTLPGRTYFNQQNICALSDKVVTLTEVDHAWWSALGFDTVQVLNPPSFAISSVVPASLDSHTCVWVGRLDKLQKQYHDAFEIARLVHERIPDFRLSVVGAAESAEETEEIAAYVHQHGMEEYIVFHGFQEDVRPFYTAASVYLSTSSMEGWGLTYMESKMFGLPMVGYDLPNIDALRKPEGMFIVPQRDIGAAAQHIIALLTDDELRRCMGREARASVERLYEVDLGDVWYDILTSTLQPPARPRPLSQRSPLEAAICCAMDSVTIGVQNIAAQGIAAQGAQTQLHAEYSRLVQLHRELQREHDQLWQKYSDESQAAAEKYAALQKENDALWQKYSDESKTAAEKYAALQKENEALWQKYSDESQAAAEKYAALQKENEALWQKYSDESKTAAEKYAALQKENEALWQKYSDESQAAAGKYAALQKENDALWQKYSAESKTAAEQYAALQKDTQGLWQRYEESAQAARDVDALYQDLREKHNDLWTQYNTVAEEGRRAYESFEAAARERDEALRELAALRAQHGDA